MEGKTVTTKRTEPLTKCQVCNAIVEQGKEYREHIDRHGSKAMTTYTFFLEVGHTYRTLDGKHTFTIRRILLKPERLDGGLIYIYRHEFGDEISLSQSNLKEWFEQERWEEVK